MATFLFDLSRLVKVALPDVSARCFISGIVVVLFIGFWLGLFVMCAMRMGEK